MYRLALAGGEIIPSEVIAHRIAGTLDYDSDPNHAAVGMKHLYAIETIEARGLQYANQDFDVLSSAYDFMVAGKRTVAA